MSGDLTDLIEFSGRLAEMRREYGACIDLPNLGRSAFAALLGVSPMLYEAYERGDLAPTVEFLAVLRRKTGASVDSA
jgi:transcriptional regulator with XRE-family HTH domain